MKKEECEEKSTEAQCVSEDKEEEEEEEEEEDEDTEKRPNKKSKKKESQQHPVSVSSPSPSITSHSPPGSQSPTPPLHSLSDSPESSISDDHRSVRHGVPPIIDERVPPPLVTAHRFQVEPNVVTKVDPGAEEGFVGVKDVERAAVTGGGGGGNRRLRPDVSSLLRWEKVAALSKLLLGLRITAFMFCLVSFSVLVADRERGWAQDSFYLYKEFRYSLSVNVIGFVYSGLQICDLVLYLITRKHIVEHALRGYFTFALDQILTYLLMSASSSAATRAYDWESNWGEDKFPYMANASVALSFIAFVAFALASLVSGSIICRFR